MAKGRRNREIRKLAHSIDNEHVRRIARRIRKNRNPSRHDVTPDKR